MERFRCIKLSKGVTEQFKGFLLEPPEHHWECPNCDLKDITRESQPHSRFHSCGGLFGISAPMVPAGTNCEVRANVREDLSLIHISEPTRLLSISYAVF